MLRPCRRLLSTLRDGRSMIVFSLSWIIQSPCRYTSVCLALELDIIFVEALFAMPCSFSSESKLFKVYYVLPYLAWKRTPNYKWMERFLPWGYQRPISNWYGLSLPFLSLSFLLASDSVSLFSNIDIGEYSYRWLFLNNEHVTVLKILLTLFFSCHSLL